MISDGKPDMPFSHLFNVYHLKSGLEETCTCGGGKYGVSNYDNGIELPILPSISAPYVNQE